jgi:hypothetical protein
MRDGAKSFANLACWADLGEARPVVMREVGFGSVHFVSGNYFETLGVNALFGRTFSATDDTPATTASSPPDVLVPIAAIQLAAATNKPIQNPGLWQMCRVIGRLRAGVSDQEARADAEQWLRAAILEHPPQAEYELPHVWLVDGGHGLGTLRDAMATQSEATPCHGSVVAIRQKN